MAAYDETNDIFQQTYSVKITPNDILTNITYSLKYNYAKRYFELNDKKDDSAFAGMYLKDYPGNMELLWVRNENTAADIVERKLNYRKRLQSKVTFQTSLQGLNDDILSDITVEHQVGPVLNEVTIVSMDLNLDDLSVIISALAFPEPVTWNLLKEDGDYLMTEDSNFIMKESTL